MTKSFVEWGSSPNIGSHPTLKRTFTTDAPYTYIIKQTDQRGPTKRPPFQTLKTKIERSMQYYAVCSSSALSLKTPKEVDRITSLDRDD